MGSWDKACLSQCIKDILVNSTACANELADTFGDAMTPATAQAFSCSDWCQSAGHGLGQIIGTAPVCKTSCSGDCPDGACERATKEMTDYGHGCAIGEKICCCSKKLSGGFSGQA